jgi:hypothetical protein
MNRITVLFYILTKTENKIETVIVKGDFETCMKELNALAGFEVMKNPSTIDGTTFTIYESHIIKFEAVKNAEVETESSN